MPPETIGFVPSRWKSASLVLLAVGMTAASGFVAWLPDARLFAKACGAFGVLFFGAAIPVAVRRVFDRRAVIEVSAWGVRDLRQHITAPWEQIERVWVWVQEAGSARVPWVVLEVKDPSAVFERADRATRALRAINDRMGYPPVVLKTQGLPRAHRGVMDAIAQFRPDLIA